MFRFLLVLIAKESTIAKQELFIVFSIVPVDTKELVLSNVHFAKNIGLVNVTNAQCNVEAQSCCNFSMLVPYRINLYYVLFIRMYFVINIYFTINNSYKIDTFIKAFVLWYYSYIYHKDQYVIFYVMKDSVFIVLVSVGLRQIMISYQ